MQCALLLLIALPLINGNCKKTPVLLISMDGFSHGYLKRLYELLGSQSRLLQLMEKSATAPLGIMPVYPSVTIPSHLSMITGQYVDEHKAVGKKFFDPYNNEIISVGGLGRNLWKYVDGEPIWATYAKLYGEKKVGCIAWLGCAAPYKGIELKNNINFSPSISWANSTRQMIDWFKSGVELGIMYHPHPDITGHMFGPKSAEMDEELKEMDTKISFLIYMLKKERLFDKINLILTSDHGMAQINKKIVIPLRPDLFDIWTKSDAYWLVQPKKGVSVDKVIDYIKKFGVPEKMKVFKKENIPQYFHFQHTHRIPSILVAAETGYALRASDKAGHSKGQHGYSNNDAEMKTIFIGHGPLFNSNVSVPKEFVTKNTNLVVRQSLCLKQPLYVDEAYKKNILPFLND